VKPERKIQDKKKEGEVRKENLSNSSCASSTQTEEHISDWNLLMQTI
jgi:hypothetical protein